MRKILYFIFLFVISSASTAKISAILFDCDGVLVDTEYMKYQAWQEALAPNQIDLTLDEYMLLVGNSSRNIIKSIKQNKAAYLNDEQIIKHKNKIYDEKHKHGAPSIEPAVKFLKSLLNRKTELGIKIAIVSSDSREAILRNLEFAGVEYQLLDGIYSGRDDLKHIDDPEGTNKPKPYIYNLAAQELVVTPTECIVFEDTYAGILSAYTAGMRVIAVPNKFTTKHDFVLAERIINFDNFTIEDLSIY